MNSCKHIQRIIPEAADGMFSEIGREAFDEHIAACSDCAEAFRQYCATLDVLVSYDRPAELYDGEEAFLDRLDHTLDEGLVAAPQSSRALTGMMIPFRWLTGRPTGIATAAAAALVAGLFIGHELFSSGSLLRSYIKDTPGVVSNENDITITAEARAKQFIDRSELILLSMLNTDIAEEFPYRPSFNRQRALSRDLLDEAVYIREGLETDSPDHARLLDLMDNLEVILMQIAALNTDYTADDLAFIQSSAERKAVLFKMNLDAVLMSGDTAQPISDSNESGYLTDESYKPFY